jgi:transposase
MYIATVPNRKSPPAILLRESYREDGKVKTRTLANLSRLPADVIDLIRRSLKGQKFISIEDSFQHVDSWHHGHIDAVLRTMKKLNFERLINSRRCKERDLVVAMVAGRILEPDNEQNSKLANTRWWEITTLPSILGLDGVNEDDLYNAMDWLLDRQKTIEKKLADRHLDTGGIVLYDLSSSYFEGVTCPLAALGHNRDGKKGKLQVNYGLLTDDRGCPVAVSVFPGNRLDHKTLTSQTEMMKNQFDIQSMVLVGDRGMITQKLIDEELRESSGVDWITALKSGAIQKLAKEGQIQLGLFDEINLFEISSEDYPDERLVVCRNPELAKQRARKRQALLDATTEKLEKVRSIVENGKLRGEDKIAKRLDSIAKKYKMAKQLAFTVRSDGFEVHIDDKQKVAEAALDGAIKELHNFQSSLKRNGVKGENYIREKVEKIITKYNIAKYAVVEIRNTDFDFHIKDKAAAAAAALESIYNAIEKIRLLVERGKYGGQDKIGVRIGKVVNKYKVAKHFVLNIRHDGFDYAIDDRKVASEAALDGIYIIRTSLPSERISAEDTVRSYKSLSQVERAFRSIKTVDLKVRPIRHRLEKRVKAHIFLCMLAYYVEWHMREAWRPLLFTDEETDLKKTNDPVDPAKRSESALQKVQTKRLDDGTCAHSFQTLLKLMSQIVCNKCCFPGFNSEGVTFEITTSPNEKQRQAYALLEKISL